MTCSGSRATRSITSIDIIQLNNRHRNSIVQRKILNLGFKEALLAISVLLCISLSHADTVLVDRQTGFLALADAVDYYEDSSEALTIDDVLAPNFGVNFIAHDEDTLHFGITSSAYWIRFDLDWSALEHSESKILEFGPPKLVAGFIRGGIEVFIVDDDGELISQYTLGTQETPNAIKTLNRGFALKINEMYGEHFYLRVTSARPLRLPISLWSEKAFLEQSISAPIRPWTAVRHSARHDSLQSIPLLHDSREQLSLLCDYYSEPSHLYFLGLQAFTLSTR